MLLKNYIYYLTLCLEVKGQFVDTGFPLHSVGPGDGTSVPRYAKVRLGACEKWKGLRIFTSRVFFFVSSYYAVREQRSSSGDRLQMLQQVNQRQMYSKSAFKTKQANTKPKKPAAAGTLKAKGEPIYQKRAIFSAPVHKHQTGQAVSWCSVN